MKIWSRRFFFDFFVFFLLFRYWKKDNVMVAGSGYWCLASDYHFKYFYTRWRNLVLYFWIACNRIWVLRYLAYLGSWCGMSKNTRLSYCGGNWFWLVVSPTDYHHVYFYTRWRHFFIFLDSYSDAIPPTTLELRSLRVIWGEYRRSKLVACYSDYREMRPLRSANSRLVFLSLFWI